MSRGIPRAGRPHTEIFPETAKELTRRVGLTETIFILKAETEDDGGGSYTTTWRKLLGPVRANLASYKRNKPRGVVADKINEFTDHIFTIDNTAEIAPPDRIERELDGSLWEVLAVDHRTDQPTIQTLAKEV